MNFFFGKDASKQDPSPSVDELASSTPDTTTEEMDTGIDTGSFIARDENNVGIHQFHDPTVSLYEEQMDKLSLSLGTIDEREDMECELIRRLIVSYFGIIRQTIQDQVPKAIMFLLVNYCKDSVHWSRNFIRNLCLRHCYTRMKALFRNGTSVRSS